MAGSIAKLSYPNQTPEDDRTTLEHPTTEPESKNLVVSTNTILPTSPSESISNPVLRYPAINDDEPSSGPESNALVVYSPPSDSDSGFSDLIINEYFPVNADPIYLDDYPDSPFYSMASSLVPSLPSSPINWDDYCDSSPNNDYDDIPFHNSDTTWLDQEEGMVLYMVSITHRLMYSGDFTNFQSEYDSYTSSTDVIFF